MAPGRIALTVDGRPVEVDTRPGETLLSVLRDRCGLRAVKDGCAPQGQCGCCTVLIDGEPRVACVTPVERVAGRSVTTVDGIDPEVRVRLADAFVASGGSQCGFCTPGIVVRAAWLLARAKTTKVDVDRALAAHLCRCTGWQTIAEAIALAGTGTPAVSPSRALDAAERRAALEGGVAQHVNSGVPLGAGGFADDTAPAGALVAVPRPPGSAAPAVEAGGMAWVIGASLDEARQAAGKVQGRHTTVEGAPPLPVPGAPPGGVALATSWVEPAYLEPDASWCEPGGVPVSPLANGGAFGGKESSGAPAAARELADRFGQPVRVVYAREDVVRLGPKRPPIAAIAWCQDATVTVHGDVIERIEPFLVAAPTPYSVKIDEQWRAVASPPGPPVGVASRAVGWAERAVLVEGALSEAGIDRAAVVTDAFAPVLLESCVVAPEGAAAGAGVRVDAAGAVQQIDIAVMAGDPLDDVVLRSYAIGAAHMAMGWVLSEGLAVDERGEVIDLTIRSFGVIRARSMPPVTVTIIDDPRPPRPRASDAVFAAVTAALWNAVAAHDGVRPSSFPARAARAARALR